MKKKLLIFVGIIITLVVIFLFMQNNFVKEANSIEFSISDIKDIKDGEYIGSYELTPVKVKTKTTIKNGKIGKIEILDHQNGLGNDAEKIIKDVIEKQSLDVDIVSGATVSSKVILKSIEEGLTK